MTKTLLLIGPSDDESQNPSTRERVQGGVQVKADFSGVLPILPYLLGDPALNANSELVVVGEHEIRIPANTRVNMFNLVGDSDASKVMLHTIEMIAKQIRPPRYFNPASHVFRTGIIL